MEMAWPAALFLTALNLAIQHPNCWTQLLQAQSHKTTINNTSMVSVKLTSLQTETIN